jgi:hypothetical protein
LLWLDVENSICCRGWNKIEPVARFYKEIKVAKIDPIEPIAPNTPNA